MIDGIALASAKTLLPGFDEHVGSLGRSIGSTIAQVDLDALRHNLAQIRRHIQPPCEVLAVVKANAYGHGALAISRVLVAHGVRMLAVSRLEEGIELREGGIRVPILVLGGVTELEAEPTVRFGLRPVVFDQSTVDILERAALDLQTTVRIHLKVDTGMGRLGLDPARALDVMQAVDGKGALIIEGLMTHFAAAESNPEFTGEQLTRFHLVLDGIRKAGLQMPMLHASNSAAILTAQLAHFDMVRSGIPLYGYAPVRHLSQMMDLKPILTWKAQIVQVKHHKPGDTIGYDRTFVVKRESRIAILPVGYADGMSRFLSNVGTVLITGRRAPIVGRICMDMMMVDVTDLPSVGVGDQVILIGQQGAETITAQDLADLIGTIPEEVLCMVCQRVPRVYTGNTGVPGLWKCPGQPGDGLPVAHDE